MNWDQYKEASSHIIEQFGKKMQKLEMEILIGKADPALKESMREDIRNILSEQFALQDQLESIEQSPDTIMQVLADIMGLKGAKRDEMLVAARSRRA